MDLTQLAQAGGALQVRAAGSAGRTPPASTGDSMWLRHWCRGSDQAGMGRALEPRRLCGPGSVSHLASLPSSSGAGENDQRGYPNW